MTRIKGIIIPFAWDDEGNVAQAGIETFDEEFFLIDPTFEISRIKTLLRQAVEISGRIVVAPGKKTIRVDRITPIKKTGINRCLDPEPNSMSFP
jgi:hypothetical protein